MPKGTSRDEVTSNSEKIKPVALAIINLCLSRSIRQSGRQSGSQLAENSIYYFFKIPKQLFESILDQSENLFGLSSTYPILLHCHLVKLRLVF